MKRKKVYLDPDKPVWVYRNLRHGRKAAPLYSIMQNGRVFMRATSIVLRDARFVVRAAGRKRVLEEGRKNVHAFVVGFPVRSTMGMTKRGRLPIRILYNPYQFGFFYCVGDRVNKVTGALSVILNEHGCTGAYLDTERIEQ